MSGTGGRNSSFNHILRFEPCTFCSSASILSAQARFRSFLVNKFQRQLLICIQTCTGVEVTWAAGLVLTAAVGAGEAFAGVVPVLLARKSSLVFWLFELW